MALFIAMNIICAGAFALAGAWPVLPFAGLDVLGIWWAFKVNFADARRAERVEITEHELILSRFAYGREVEEKRFIRRWVRVELEEDTRSELVGSLFLAFGGQRTEIARFLAADEKKSFATALKAALTSPHI